MTQMLVPMLVRSTVPSRAGTLVRSRLFSSHTYTKKFVVRQATLSTLLAMASSGTAVVALCDDGKDDDMMTKLKKMVVEDGDFDAKMHEIATTVGGKVQEAVDSGVPTQLSYGFISGFCSGYAMKKAGRAAAVVLGMGFVSLQALNYAGYINVDHVKIKKDVENMMDLNDDGKLDEKDASQALNKVMEVVGYNLPSGGGFAAGFMGGLRAG